MNWFIACILSFFAGYLHEERGVLLIAVVYFVLCASGVIT